MAATTTEARFHFFGGKGGVGKTTCAAAWAVAAASRGDRVLVVSTDPAHSLGDALDVRLSSTPRRVWQGLSAVELDADGALARWLEERRDVLREILSRGTYFDEDDLEKFLRLSLPGVDELVGLIELSRLAASEPWDEVIVDTAPTGHTLRLLAMPETLKRVAVVLDDMNAKHRLLAQSLGGRHIGDAADALIDEIDSEGRRLAALLADNERARFSWVLLPEALSVSETEDGLAGLREREIFVEELIVNRVTPPPADPCALCEGRRRAEAEALQPLAARKERMRQIAALEVEPRGIAALQKISVRPGLSLANPRVASASPPTRASGFTLSARDDLRLLVFAGKGGVGKTTCATAAALQLAAAHPERKILLLSTDPAHSLGDALGIRVGDEGISLGGLRARELDAERAFATQRERYREAIDDLFDRLRGDSRFDATYDRQVAQDLIELAPPGLDELFAIWTVMDALWSSDGAFDLVVLDTAPTGHALRLLALPTAAHEWVKALMQVLLKYRHALGLGQLAADLLELSRGLSRLTALITDEERTRVVAVTRPAALPRLETQRLLSSLARLGIAVSAVLINAVTPPGCSRCRRAGRREREEVAALERSSGCAILTAPAAAPPPRGLAALVEWSRHWNRA